MKRILFTVFFMTCALFSFAQSSEYAPQMAKSSIQNKDAKYLMFPTRNINIFLKLNTRTGEIWMVQIGLGDNKSKEIKFPSWCYPLIPKEEESNGRFMLYPTQNLYNFILIDQINGRIWQAQWSFKESNRGILPILYY